MVKKKSKKKILKKKKIDSETKQLLWFFGVVILVFILFLGTYYGVRSQKHFVFGGAEWWVEGEREGWGDLTLYHARYPVVYAGELYTNMNLWLYNDPRENNISADVDFFANGIAKDVVITFSSDLMECSDRNIIIPQLTQVFGTGLPWTTTSGGIANVSAARNLGLPYADCFNVTDDKTVIYVHEGKESKVYSEWGCYHVAYETCDDAMKSSEKLILELISQLNE
ncbi:hypothetical protein CMI41_00880 [Candidatus Pacearchaeota archaeon]|nr:hypothetical protein [Candidatus Pacearchaeota archaeon]|tara:strand:+ start:2533 stop:3207 length:675 start_codon:yes stop_codon:yes gene_type:complete